jgi:hypothetical protein
MTIIQAITSRDPALKAEMGPGPWQDEPDRAQWYDPDNGMACLIVRQHHGAWCGYVGVEPGHPWHGVSYGECVEPDCGDEWWHYDCTPGGKTSVHGGLTYSAPCQEGADAKVCHVPAKGRPDNVWWFGFDCAHDGDLVPATERLMANYGSRGLGGAYRDIDYVRAEVAHLAAQLAEAPSGPEAA